MIQAHNPGCVTSAVSPLIPAVSSTTVCFGAKLEKEGQVFVVSFLLIERAPEL